MAGTNKDYADRGDQTALLWDIQDIAAALSIGSRTLWRWISTGVFPAPDLSVGAKVRRWKRESVADWVEARAKRPTGSPIKTKV